LLEFVLSRVTLSICATMLILCLAPWFVGSMEGADDDLEKSSFQELALIFTGATTSPHRLHLEVRISDYLSAEGSFIHLEKGSIWLVRGTERMAQEVPSQFMLFMLKSGIVQEVQSADLTGMSKLTIVREEIDGRPQAFVYIENLDATSCTASAKRSTSSSLLYM